MSPAGSTTIGRPWLCKAAHVSPDRGYGPRRGDGQSSDGFGQFPHRRRAAPVGVLDDLEAPDESVVVRDANPGGVSPSRHRGPLDRSQRGCSRSAQSIRRPISSHVAAPGYTSKLSVRRFARSEFEKRSVFSGQGCPVSDGTPTRLGAPNKTEPRPSGSGGSWSRHLVLLDALKVSRHPDGLFLISGEGLTVGYVGLPQRLYPDAAREAFDPPARGKPARASRVLSQRPGPSYRDNSDRDMLSARGHTRRHWSEPAFRAGLF
jgi:hypothetical protein